MADREVPVVTVPQPSAATSSIALIMEESVLGSFWVLRPRSWSAMRLRSRLLGEADCAAEMEEQVIVRWLSLGFGGRENVEEVDKQIDLAMAWRPWPDERR